MYEIASERAGRDPLIQLRKPEIQERLNLAATDIDAWFEYIPKDTIAPDMTPFDLRRDMRRDLLDMTTSGEIDSIGDHFRGSHALEFWVLSYKYQPVLTVERPDHMDVSREWENAREWARERVNTNIWLGECDLGNARRFITRCPKGLETALYQLGAAVCYDLRSQTPKFILPDGKYIELNDREEANLRSAISETFSFAKEARSAKKAPKAIPAAWSLSDWNTCLNTILSWNTVDPFEQWLRKLPEWDSQPRVDTWLKDCGFDFGLTDPELVTWACRSIPMLCVSRAIDPGSKHDTIPVLIGPQGIGKSTALAWLLPPENRLEWFNDNLRLSADEKSKVESLQGAVLVEVSEMSGATSAEIEALKAFLSRASDRVRLAYRRNPEVSPRRCAIVGTANGNAVLPNDPSGNRRFVALGLRGGSPHVVRKWLDINRKQLWAEALKRVNLKEIFWFPEKLIVQQQEANESYRSSDAILEDAVSDWIKARPVYDGMPIEDRLFTMKAIAEEVGMVKGGESAPSMPVAQTRRLGRVLHQFGCERIRHRVDGKIMRLWQLPVGPKQESEQT